MSQTKERPILFSGPMVRAILDGRKTQTRRIVKGQPALWLNDSVMGKFVSTDSHLISMCPYGKPGDRLWVRETCRAEELPCGLDGVRYAADNAFIEIENTQAASDRWADLFYYGKSKGKGVPSIHMPRWASRITLEITNVRVERLNDISEADAISEGVVCCGGYWLPSEDINIPCTFAYGAYKSLWESINGPESWAANPWVWVVEFRRVTP